MRDEESILRMEKTLGEIEEEIFRIKRRTGKTKLSLFSWGSGDRLELLDERFHNYLSRLSGRKLGSLVIRVQGILERYETLFSKHIVSVEEEKRLSGALEEDFLLADTDYTQDEAYSEIEADRYARREEGELV
jgi:hypothetical protein